MIDIRTLEDIATLAASSGHLEGSSGHLDKSSGHSKRAPEALRKQYLKPLVDQGKLALAFPTAPTHPQQAYTAVVPGGKQ